MLNSQQDDVHDCNIDTKEEVRNIKILGTLPQEIKDKYIKLFKEYKDVFSWRYKYLNIYATFIIEHNIPLKLGAKSFQQKQRRINPILLPIIEKEVKKLLDAKIIVPLIYYD